MAMLLLLGAAAGLVSGLIGIGGGVVIVPALIYGFGLTQHQGRRSPCWSLRSAFLPLGRITGKAT